VLGAGPGDRCLDVREDRVGVPQRELAAGKVVVLQVDDDQGALGGLGSAVSLRHHFRKAFAVSPTGWRQTFRGP